MMKTILIAHDGSDHAEAAVPVAIDLARQYGARVVVAHIDERIAAKGDMPPLRADQEVVEQRLRERTAEIAAEGIDATVEIQTVVLGGPAKAIVEIADRVGADLIVTGTRGQSALTGLLVGSVAHRLLHLAEQPVLVVPSRG